MSLRSLFVKIFLWFWLSFTIVIASLALVTWIYPYSAVPTGRLPDRLHEMQVRGALAVYELKGVEAFQQHRDELRKFSRLRTYFVDDQGREISGEKVPQFLLDFAKERAADLEQGQRVMADDPRRLIIPLTDSRGRKYLALVEGDRPMPSSIALGDSNRGGGGGPGHTHDRGPGHAANREGEPGRGPESRPAGESNRGGDFAQRPEGGPAREPSRRGPPPDPTPRFELLVPTHVLLLRLLAVVLAAGMGCYALARYLTAPVRKLQNAARQLASGDLSARVGRPLAGRRDEIGELGRDFDRMAEQVQGLVTTQRRLLQDVSHELRSPLARLNVALELAGREAGPGAAPALTRVGREAERLNELIGQLLTLARLEGGTAQPQPMRTDLRALVKDVAADADFEAAARDCHVRVARSEACEILGAPDLLRSGLENVMRNAVHYTAAGTEVEVALFRQGPLDEQSVTIEIRDHGPGVPEESLNEIFRPFYRVSSARDRQSGGTGLGLAITHRAVRLHHGTVQAANAPGGGLVVRITLPLNHLHSDADQPQ